MATQADIEQALRDAGTQLKKDLWQPTDAAFLVARAKDLIGLNSKAAAATDPAIKNAYLASAKDVLEGVKLLAIVRMEAGATHLADAIGRFFLDKVLPILGKLLPAVFGL